MLPAPTPCWPRPGTVTIAKGNGRLMFAPAGARLNDSVWPLAQLRSEPAMLATRVLMPLFSGSVTVVALIAGGMLLATTCTPMIAHAVAAGPSLPASVTVMLSVYSGPGPPDGNTNDGASG